MQKGKIPSFDLTHQWHQFCERSGLPENKMPPDQRREMKRAFFGACGQLLIVFKDELGEYIEKNGEEAGIKIMMDMLNQVQVFWEGEVLQHNSKSQ